MKTITEESNVLKYKNKRGTNPKELKANGYCTLLEAAEILEVSSACLSFWRIWDATHGLPPRLPYRKENGRYYYLKSDVFKYKNKRGTNPKELKANGYCTLQEIAEILEVSSACLPFWRKWDVKHGLPPRLPYRKENGRYYYLRSDVLEYKNKRGTNPKELKANGYCTLQEAAEILEVSSTSLSFWCKWDAKHGLPPRLPYRIENKRYYYLRSDVLEYKNKRDKEMKEHEENDYCSAQEAAKILKIYPAKLSLWRKIDRNRYQQDRIPYIRRGYWIFYRRKDVYAYKEKMDKEKNGNARI